MDQTVPAYAAEVADYGRSRDPEPGEGALVKNVRPESPAWDVGIEPGMRVLTVNGEQLTDMIVWLWEADDDTVDLEGRSCPAKSSGGSRHREYRALSGRPWGASS